MKKFLAVVFCLCVAVLALTSCSNGNAVPTAAPRTEPPMPETTVGAVEASPLTFAVLGVSTTTKTLFKPVETDGGNTYALIFVEIKNVGDTVAAVNSNKNFALYVNGEKVEQVFNVDVYLQPDFTAINAGDVKRGEIAYRLPEGAASGEFAFLADDGTEIGRVPVTF